MCEGTDQRVADAQRLWICYSVADPRSLADRYRNPYSALLTECAARAISRLRELVSPSACRVVLGGSFGYDAALVGSYDLDLRLLLPDTTDEQMKMVSALVEVDIPFDRVIIAQESGERIYHHTKNVSLAGVPQPVKLSLNIQSAEKYFGIAELARQLPQVVRDRYVAARGMAREKGIQADASAIKQHWQAMIAWLEQQGMRGTGSEGLSVLLERAQPFFPLFLKSGRLHD